MSLASSTAVALSSPLPTSATVTSSPDRDARTARSSVADARTAAVAVAAVATGSSAGAPSTSTMIRLRDVRTRCGAARSRSTRTRASGMPSAAGALLDAHAADRRLGRRQLDASGGHVAQVDQHGERVGLGGHVGHRLGGFDDDRADSAVETGGHGTQLGGFHTTRRGAGYGPGPRQSGDTRGYRHKWSDSAEHHLPSSWTRKGFRTSRCFWSDSGSLTCCRITTASGVIARTVPSNSLLPARTVNVRPVAPDTIAT